MTTQKALIHFLLLWLLSACMSDTQMQIVLDENNGPAENNATVSLSVALAGTPTDPTNNSALAITVSGTSINQYAYAIIAQSSTCSGATYSAWTSLATLITDSVSDGEHRLCVKGRTSANAESSATQFDWIQDTVPPTLTSFQLRDASDNSATGTDDLNVTAVMAASGTPTPIQYCVSSSSSTPTTGAGCWSASTSQSVAITLATSTIYAWAKDAYGNISSAMSDTIAINYPVIALSNTPAASSTTTPLNITVGGNYVATYDYALTNQITACGSATFTGSWIGIATPITDAPPSGNNRLCVKARTAGGIDSTSTYVFNWSHLSGSVDQIDDDNSAMGFLSASHTSTVFSGGVLTLNATTSRAELDESWTPKWSALQGYWKMDNNWDDSSVNANHGTIGGTPAFTASSKVGSYAGLFDGLANTSVVAANIANYDVGTGDLSIMSWVYCSDITDYSWIFKKDTAFPSGNGINLSINQTTGYANVNLGGTVLVGTINICDSAWHHYAVTRTSGTAYLYIDGVLNVSGSTPNTVNVASSNIVWANYMTGGSYSLTGRIDDFSFWSDDLSSDEVHLIYSRQAAKYSGHMKSRIIDALHATSTWTTLDWLTSLPFGKELPDGSGAAFSESSADYTSLSTSTLMAGLVGLWHLNGPVGIPADNANVPDASATGNNGQIKDGDGSNTIAYRPGYFAQGIKFDGANDYVALGSKPVVTDFTISAWIYANDISNYSAWGAGIFRSMTADSLNDFAFGVDSSGRLKLLHWENSGTDTDGFHMTATNIITSGKWYHVAATVRGVEHKLYVNGEQVPIASRATTSAGWDTGYEIGRQFNGGATYHWNGMIDEVALWNRALSLSDIRDIYRRGANRIKFQVRSCSSSNCSDQDALSGDGWKGPGGDYLTYFSELYNNSSVSSSCVVPQQCSASELSLDGDVQIDPASMLFSAFGAHGITVSNNRYFQYRAILESDDQVGVCSASSTCLPQLRSVEIGPAHSY